jgi:GT2 family glycosyltransferase
MTKVAVVILNYNGRDFLAQFIPFLIKHTPDAELIVADNNSTDDSLDVLSQFPSIKSIRLHENYGYAGGYNNALMQVEADYYLLLNSDIEVSDNWLTPLVDYLDLNSNYAAAQPKLLDYYNRDRFEYAGAAGGFLDSLAYPYCKGRVFNDLERDSGQYDIPSDIMWASGAAFIIRSEIFHELGGFDETFFAHMEEIDLCWRLKSHGYKIAFVPESKVYHVGGGTLNKTSPRKTYLNFRNGIKLLLKNLPKSELIYKLPLRVVLDVFASFYIWRNETQDHFKAVLKGVYDALKDIKRCLKFKRRSQPLINGQSFQILPFRYFLKSQKTFDQINNTK